jgi:colanic acid biosynthesis glycosyl transferase WcaI
VSQPFSAHWDGTATDICMLSLHFPPEPTGNAPYSGGLASGLAAAGQRVTVHAGHPHYPEWKIYDGHGGWTQVEEFQGVQVKRRLHYVPRPPRGLRRLISELSFGVRLAFSRWDSPGVVIALSPPLFSTALAVARLRLMPRRPSLLVWVQDLYSLGLAETGEGGDFVQRVTRWVERQTLGAADRVVVIHERFADYVANELGIPSSKVVVLRNWTHLPPSVAVDSAKAKAKLGWPSSLTLAVHSGNMGAKQGLENVVDAARLADERKSPVHFILVGEGSERQALEAQGARISRLTFVDPLNEENFRLALGAADVLIVNEKPGVSAMAMPSKLTSYFDAGRPVVAATDRGGITASEITAAQAGIVVPAGDPAALLDAVLMLRAHPDTAARYGANGRRYREINLGEAQAMDNWKRLIQDVGRGSPAEL